MGNISRRTFLASGVAGAGAIALGSLAGCSPSSTGSSATTSEVGGQRGGGAATSHTQNVVVHEADVIVVGSGIAGLTAARRAIDEGATVAIIDKGPYGHSGASGHNWGHSVATVEYADPASLPAFAAGLLFVGDGMVDQNYMLNLATAWHDVRPMLTSVQLGSVTEHNKEGVSCSVVNQANSVPENPTVQDAGLFPRVFARQVKRAGAQIYDYTYALDVLKDPDGATAGIAAINLKTGEPVVFRSRAVILATGSFVWLCGWNGMTPYSHSSADCTGDGAAMFIRAGLPMRDMEEICQDNGQWYPTGTRQCMTGMGVELPDHYRGFNNNYESFSDIITENPAAYMNQGTYMRLTLREIWQGRGTEHGGIWALTDDLENEERYYRPAKWNMKRIFDYDLPQYVELVPQAWETAGRPFNIDPQTCETEVSGLFYAGGAPTVWNGFVVASCMGSAWMAGKAAADLTRTDERGVIDWNQVSDIFNEAYSYFDNTGDDAIRSRKLMRNVQNAFWDGMYFLRDEEGIQGTIDELTRIQNEDLPHMGLGDHTPQFNMDWRNALETRNMVTVGIAAAQAALIRRETRGAHCRTDYPKVDNENYMVNTKVALKDGSWESELVPVDDPLVSREDLIAGIATVGID